MTGVKTQGNINHMTDSEVVNKIRDYLNKHNLRQWELARKLNIPERTLSRWMTKQVKISAAYLRILKEEGII